MTTLREHGRAAASEDPGRQRRTASPLLAGLIALAATAAFAGARWATWARGNIGNFILVGRHFAIVAQVPPGIPVQPTYGYDGEWYYRLALNPANLSPVAYGIRIDRGYRYMRMGYPALTWVLSAGRQAVVPYTLVAVNVLAVGVLGYLGAVIARRCGRNPLWGLLLPGFFGLLTSVSRDTGEPLAVVCLLAGLLAFRARRPVLAGALLACGALTRETAMVAVAALALARVAGLARDRRRPGRDDVAWALPAAAFAAWQAAAWALTGVVPLVADKEQNAGTPFTAPAQALIFNLGHLSPNPADQYDVWVLEFAILLLVVVAALVLLRRSQVPGHEKLAFVLYVIEICAVTPSTWSSVDADLRSFVEAYLLAVIVLLGVPAARLGRRLAWILPVLGVALVPALVLVTERRLTLSLCWRSGAGMTIVRFTEQEMEEWREADRRTPRTRKLFDLAKAHAEREGGETLELWRHHMGRLWGIPVMMTIDDAARRMNISESRAQQIYDNSLEAIRPEWEASPEYGQTP